MRSPYALRIILGLTALLPSPAAAESACGRGAQLAPGAVERIVDFRTIILSDGREIRLAGIELPPVSATEESPDRRSLYENQARAALEQATDRQELVLKAARTSADRYGRSHAFAFVKREGLERSLQHDMLARGLALVAPRVGSLDCTRELLALERDARAARVGIWADAGVVRDADQPSALLTLRGKATLVEGRVLSVRESGGTIYVNFGRRWSEDFTVTIPKRDERGLIASGLTPKLLERRRVRVRGFIEERGGPWIEVRHAEQIEVLQE